MFSIQWAYVERKKTFSGPKAHNQSSPVKPIYIARVPLPLSLSTSGDYRDSPGHQSSSLFHVCWGPKLNTGLPSNWVFWVQRYALVHPSCSISVKWPQWKKVVNLISWKLKLYSWTSFLWEIGCVNALGLNLLKFDSLSFVLGQWIALDFDKEWFCCIYLDKD